MARTYTPNFTLIRTAWLAALSLLVAPVLALSAPVPNAALSNFPDSVLVGEDAAFEVTFDNASTIATDIGYGPYIDLTLPKNGTDGAGAGEAGDDGCTFTSAKYLGATVTSTTFIFPADGDPVVNANGVADSNNGDNLGEIAHPYAVDGNGDPVIIKGTPGDELTVLQLPFGSFTPEQPAVTVDVGATCSSEADANKPLNFTASGGFQFGKDALDNPEDSDPSIVGTPSAPETLRPTVIKLEKTYIGPENETATGPSFPRCYRIDVRIAPGQTVENLTITDSLPANMQFIEVVNGTDSLCPGATGSAPQGGTTLPSTTQPGGTIAANMGNVTDSNGADSADTTLLFKFFIPKTDANGEIIETDDGNPATSQDTASAAGTWDPIDEDDPTTGVASAAVDNQHTLQDQSIAIQKSVEVVGGGELKPGAILKYTVDFQVSDYFAFDDVKITDVISDGQRFCSDGSVANSVSCTCTGGDCTPTLEYTEHGAISAEAQITPANLIVSGCYSGASPGPTPGTGTVCDDPTLNGTTGPLSGGETVLEFDISKELVLRAGNDSARGKLLGGCIPQGGTQTDGSTADCDAYDNSEQGPTTGQLVFYTQVQDNFTNLPAGEDPSVDHGDKLNNDADIDGQVLDTKDLSTQTTCPVDTANPGGICRQADNTATSEEIEFGKIGKRVYAVDKAIASNPDAGYSNPEIGPGKVITYQLEYDLPNTDFENLVLTDYLPLPVLDVAGLSFKTDKPECQDYLDNGDNPLEAGVVCFKTKRSEATLTGSKQDTFYRYGTEATTPPSPRWSPPADFFTKKGAENSASFNFGTFDDDRNETTTVVLLLSVESNDKPFADALFLTNQLRATEKSTNGTENIADNIVQFQLREPKLTIEKIASPTSGIDAGDTVTFTVTVENTGGAPAHAVTISDLATDQLKDAFDCNALTPADVTDGESTPTQRTFGGSFDATGITLADPLPKEDGKAVVTLTCKAKGTIEPNQKLTNTAQVKWKASATATEFFAPKKDDAEVTTKEPTVVKTITSPVDGSNNPLPVTVGDTVSYSIAVTLPEGTTKALQLVDTLPKGYEYVGGTVTLDTTGFDTNATGLALVAITPGSTVANGQTVTISLGDITLPGEATDSGNNSFKVTLQALVKDVTANIGQPREQTKTNTVRAEWTDTDNQTQKTPDATTSNAFQEPKLKIAKTMTPNRVDAGDWVTITLTVTNKGTWPAYDVVVTDTLNQGSGNDLLDLNTVVLVGAAPAGYTYGYANPRVTFTQEAGTSLAAGASVVLKFRAQVKTGVASGSTIANTANVEGDGHEGANPGGERPTTHEDDESINTAKASAVKSLIASSEPWTNADASDGDLEAAIGEILTYQATFTIPEGTTEAQTGAGARPIIVDTLPEGLKFIAGSAKLHATGVASTIQTANGGGISTDAGNPDSVTAAVSGQELRFDLGTIENDDRDTDAEKLVFTYRVLVQNVAANQRTERRANSAALNYQTSNGSHQSIVATLPVTIVEPNPTVTKTATPAVVTGSGTATFVATLTNTPGTAVSEGWEPTLEDTLPARYRNPKIIRATLKGTNANLDVKTCARISGQTVSFTSDCLDANQRRLAPGESIELEYSATVDPAIAFEEVVTNTVTARMTSLPGDKGTGGTTPGASGSGTGERTGSGGVNDLAVSNTADVTADRPTLTKTGATNLQIGETTTMTLSVGVPVGTTNLFKITDVLPAGLTFVSGTARAPMPSGVTASENAAPPSVSGNTLTFDFGTITNNSSGARTITISYEVQVENILTNQAGAALTNTATLSYQGVKQPKPTASATLTVVEPNLEIAKRITSGATRAAGGDVIGYQVAVSNTSTTGTAYRVDLQDTLPDELQGASPVFGEIAVTNPGDAVVVNGTGAALAATHADQTTTGTLTWPAFDLPPQTTLTIDYEVTVKPGVTAGSDLTNEVTASYHSLKDAAASGGRDGSQSTDDEDGKLNNYGETTDATLVISSDLALDKSLNAVHVGSNAFTVGDEIVFDLRVDLAEVTYSDLTITDTLPAGLQFVRLDGITANRNITHQYSDPPVENGRVITFDLGKVVNTPDADTNNDFLVLRLRARVADDETNSRDGRTLENEVSLTSGSTTLDATADVRIIEPALTLTKTPSNAAPAPGETVTWTIAVANTSADASAHDVVLTDAIPASLTYVTGSTQGATVDESNAASPKFSFSSIGPAETRTFSFQTLIGAGAIPGQKIDNKIGVTYDGQPDSPTVQRTYDDDTTGSVTPSATAFVDAVKTVKRADGQPAENLLPGDTLEYTIVLTAFGGTATNVVFTDPIPANTSYVAGSLTTTRGTRDESDTGKPKVTIASMPKDSTVTITFQVKIAAAAAGTTLSNQGQVTVDGRADPEPTDQDGDDTNGDQPTQTPVGTPPAPGTPGLRLEKRAALLTDADDSSTITPGDTLQYRFLLRNTGDKPLTNLRLSDTIPAGLTYAPGSVSAPADSSASVSGNALSVTGIGPLAVGTSATVTLQVTVDDPLYNNAAQGDDSETFVNQATASSTETGTVRSDGDDDLGNGEQPTQITAVTGDKKPAALNTTKRVSLTTDADDNGVYSGGDTVRYVLTVTNSGTGPATGVVITDALPGGLEPVVGSTATSQGRITGHPPALRVELGDLAPGASATVSFSARIAAGTPEGTRIRNVGQVGSTDDAPIETPPVVIEIGDDPVDSNQPPLTARKRAELAVDRNGDGAYSPGDVVRYVMTTTNTGSEPATGVVLTDLVPSGLVLIAGSATTTQGTITAESPTLRVEIGTLAPGASATVTFKAGIPESTPLGTRIGNIVVVDSTEGHPIEDGPVEIPIEGPVVWDPPSGFKTVDASNYPELVWQMVWINSGNLTALGVRVEDPLPGNIDYIADSLECIARGASTMTRCEYDPATRKVIYAGDIAPDFGATGEADAPNAVIIRFSTTVTGTEANNQGFAYWDEGPPVSTDDPVTPPGGDPTVWRLPGNPIPALSPLGLLVLVLAILGLARAIRPRRRV